MGSVTKLKKKSMFDKGQFESLAREYNELSAQIKVLESRKKKLAELIKKGATSYGVKDDKGSSYLDLDGYIIGNVAKKSMSINQDEAIAMLEEKGLEECIEVVTVRQVNNDLLTNAVSKGKLSLNDIEKVTDVKISYAVSVTAKEEVPEIEQTTLKAAKRK